MFSCRAAWQRCGPLARTAAYRLPLDGEFHQRAALDVCLLSTVCVGDVLSGYKTVTSDRDRYNDRISQLRARPKAEWTPKPWPPKGKSPPSLAPHEEFTCFWIHLKQ
uniref:Uncharacterized protein n=1 Tax=Xiphophorus couchianus TaxID=32473 RepID=A0A3B5M4D5_9TELE